METGAEGIVPSLRRVWVKGISGSQFDGVDSANVGRIVMGRSEENAATGAEQIIGQSSWVWFRQRVVWVKDGVVRLCGAKRLWCGGVGRSVGWEGMGQSGQECGSAAG